MAGRKPEAVQSYRRALEIQPNNPVVMNNLAALLADLGQNLDEALALAQHAQNLIPNNPAIDDTIGSIYLKKGMDDTAIRVFDSLARKNPNISTIRFHLGMALLHKGEKQKAREELNRALEAQPSPGEATAIRSLIAKIG
jgi:Flp pilus assembly protein TadD